MYSIYIYIYIHAYARYTYYVRLGCFVSCLSVCVSSWREFSNRFGVGVWDSESRVCADVHAKLLLLSLRALMRGSLLGDQLGMEFFAYGGLNCEVVFFRRLWEITTCTRFLTTGPFIIRAPFSYYFGFTLRSRIIELSRPEKLCPHLSHQVELLHVPKDPILGYFSGYHKGSITVL